MPNCNNKEVNLQEKIDMKSQKALELANSKGRFNREVFVKGDKVHIHDPTSKLLTHMVDLSLLRERIRISNLENSCLLQDTQDW